MILLCTSFQKQTRHIFASFTNNRSSSICLNVSAFILNLFRRSGETVNSNGSFRRIAGGNLNVLRTVLADASTSSESRRNNEVQRLASYLLHCLPLEDHLLRSLREWCDAGLPFRALQGIEYLDAFWASHIPGQHRSIG